MSRLRAFASYYVRNTLPFLTGLGFGLILFRFDIPLVWLVAIGAVLVVAGPFAIQTLLVLVVEALRGGPDAATREADVVDVVDVSDFNDGYDDEPAFDPTRLTSDDR